MLTLIKKNEEGLVLDPQESNKHKTYLDIAKLWAKESHCERNKVGCIIVKDQMIISDGYNGTPHGFNNSCEIDNITKEEVIHAEANAICKFAKSTNNSINSTIYITVAPCFECAKLIIQSNIKRVIYQEDYRNNKGLQLLRKAKIDYDKW